MLTLESGSVLSVYLQPVVCRTLAGLDIFHASGWIESKEVEAQVAFLLLFCF